MSNSNQIDLSRRDLLISSAVAAVVTGAGERSVAAQPAGDKMKLTTPVTLNVNGARREIEVDNRTTLLDALREHLDLTGTKRVVTMANVEPAPSWSMVGGSMPV